MLALVYALGINRRLTTLFMLVLFGQETAVFRDLSACLWDWIDKIEGKSGGPQYASSLPVLNFLGLTFSDLSERDFAG